MDAPQQASTKIRSLHAEIKSTHANQDVPSTEQLGEWRKAAASAARECIALERLIASEKHRHGVELEIMLEEMRSELVTREANAARTAERFRVLAEKNGGGSDSSAYDRAVQTAETVDAASDTIFGTEFRDRSSWRHIDALTELYEKASDSMDCDNDDDYVVYMGGMESENDDDLGKSVQICVRVKKAGTAVGKRKASIIKVKNDDPNNKFGAVWKFMGSKSPERVVTDEDREMVRSLSEKYDNFADTANATTTSKHLFCLMLMAGKSAEHETQSGMTYRYSRDIKHFFGLGKFHDRSDINRDNIDQARRIALAHVDSRKHRQSVGRTPAIYASDKKWLKRRHKLAGDLMCAFQQYCALLSDYKSTN